MQSKTVLAVSLTLAVATALVAVRASADVAEPQRVESNRAAPFAPSDHGTFLYPTMDQFAI